ncbi:palmitoyl-monogalactosyldiacylglycerol delta-7 desaturase, chloroplastic-like isoform X1 [Rhodamnia argentea]|uniref:Palmitoyl-monogalactosyldiacylglycerol delta-7 desaturase, chloroplastic-like isoform X1 n=1 Tax=Rhodamnia argentea TaxID=178133 RepID=A0A8B8NUK2_9MYRT|nr:palmitoyl-monogalactosyldiacylglycerol delta-7 desaturase, chloroplastic-like isoform X1 [Rhodamnia argentea]
MALLQGNPKPFLLSPRRLPIRSSTHPTSFNNRQKLNLNLRLPILINALRKFPIRSNLPSKSRTSRLNAEAGSVGVSETEATSGRRILLSDVVVKRKRRVFSGRKWNSLDIGTAGVVLAMHLLSLLAPFYFSWTALWVAVSLYLVTGLLGITLSFHRNLSHRSFKLRKWLEYLFAYCGVLALQGNPIDWVSTHRYHHQHCDSERDPHSPLEGFWFSHMSWLFDTNSVVQRCGGPNNVGDLEKQPFYRFLQRTYIAHPIALAVLLNALGGVPFLLWGMCVRIVWVYHITWLVNSACHVWGKQAWNTGDLSRNNWWVAVLAFGEGWHNNHHAFEYSARHGIEWWQLDITWYVVRLLQVLGLATDVKLPSEAQKQRLALNMGTAC